LVPLVFSTILGAATDEVRSPVDSTREHPVLVLRSIQLQNTIKEQQKMIEKSPIKKVAQN
jgi:hypothetical protein